MEIMTPITKDRGPIGCLCFILWISLFYNSMNSDEPIKEYALKNCTFLRLWSKVDFFIRLDNYKSISAEFHLDGLSTAPAKEGFE